jgi:hypothetical protein
MKLSLSQAAERLGKTQRQIRYLIKQGKLDARKDGGRWVVDSDRLPVSDEQRAARQRQETRLRDAVDAALDTHRQGRYSLRDLKAVTVGAPIYRSCLQRTGPDSIASRELRASLDHLAVGYHRYALSEKRDSYRAARDAAARAAMDLALSELDGALELADLIEQELMPAIAGILRRTERRGDRL